MGYVGSFLPKPRSACQVYGFPPDGCTIFYKEHTFDALQEPAFYARVFPTQEGASEPGSQGVLLVHLRHKQGGGCVTVACTHLKAKAGEANELLREFQVVGMGVMVIILYAVHTPMNIHTPNIIHIPGTTTV